MEIDVKHHQHPGVYAREMRLPKGYMVNSHKHIFTHMSILAQGVAEVTVAGITTMYTAPAVVSVEKDEVHSIVALEDILWFCIHNEDNFKIEEIQIKESICHGQQQQ